MQRWAFLLVVALGCVPSVPVSPQIAEAEAPAREDEPATVASAHAVEPPSARQIQEKRAAMRAAGIEPESAANQFGKVVGECGMFSIREPDAGARTANGK